MKTQVEHVQRWDDIIFEKRNKEYGAYIIRKQYDDRVLTGWTISLGIVALVFLGSFFSFDEVPHAPTFYTDHGGHFIPPPVVKPDVKATPVTPPAPRQVNRNLPPVVTTHDVPDQPVEPIEPQTTVGTEGTGTPTEGVPQTSGINLDPVEVAPTQPAFYLVPEVMPAYAGGLKALAKDLQKHMKYPRIAERNETEGTVYVSFIISASGRVTQVEVVKGISKECDQEAVRVISLMNKWSPGLQNKMPVAVKMVLPISFKLSR